MKKNKETVNLTVLGEVKGKITRTYLADKWTKDGEDVYILSTDVGALRAMSTGGYRFVETVIVKAEMTNGCFLKAANVTVEVKMNGEAEEDVEND